MRLSLNSCIFIALVLGIGYIVLVTAASSLPANTLSLKHDNKAQIYSIVPQGFGYFTRDPREANTNIYQKQGENWVQLNGPSMTSENLFGLVRKHRRLSGELGAIVGQIKNMWGNDCKGEVGKGCLPEMACRVIELENPYEEPMVLGELLLHIVEPVPWAWSKSLLAGEVEAPATILRVKVSRKEG